MHINHSIVTSNSFKKNHSTTICNRLENNHSITTHKSVQHHHSTIICTHSIIKDLNTINHAEIIKVTEEASKEDVVEEEALEEVDDL
jgi:hypothetical protein